MTFWQVADSSPEQWTTQRSLTVPSAMALGELIHQICTISTDKAHRIAQAVNQFKDVSAPELEHAGLTQRQAAKLLAAIELGKRVFTASPRTELITDPQSSASLLQYDLGYSALEKGAVLILDIKHRLISKEIIAIGNDTGESRATSHLAALSSRTVRETFTSHSSSTIRLLSAAPITQLVDVTFKWF
jgi:DNA repair protein RadC